MQRTAIKIDGMGAIPHEGGVAFRVWAPNADAVAVVGDFNDWYSEASPMRSEGNGNWCLDVPAAAVGDQYRYLLRNGDQELSRIDPRALVVTNSVGNGVVYDHAAFDWQGDDFTAPTMDQLVIYELHVGSFYRRAEDEVGSLELVGEQFDHLLGLGVNAIQIMPIAEFAGDMSWGYNPAHIFAVESAYGGPDALKTFVREAHQRGLAVIVDVVYNHFGPSDLDLWRFDGWGEDDKGGIYFYNDHRSSTPWGDTRPDYGRDEVRRFIHDNAVMWLRDYHADGLRMDMTPYMYDVDADGRDIPEGWDVLRWVNTSIREQFPEAITIAEDMHQDASVTQVDDDGAAFHAQWDSAFVHPVREAVIGQDDGARSMHALRDAVATVYNGDAFQRVVYTESHDEVANGKARVPHEIDADDPTGWYAQKRSTIGAALVLTSPGIPMLLQGQEFLQGGWFRDDVPLDWHNSEDFAGTVRLYRDLVRLRLDHDGTTAGLTGQHTDVLHLDDEANVFAFHRRAEGGIGDDTVVVVNLAAEGRDVHLRFPAAGEWVLRCNTDASVYSPEFRDEGSGDLSLTQDADGAASADVRVAPYSVLVYSLAG